MALHRCAVRGILRPRVCPTPEQRAMSARDTMGELPAGGHECLLMGVKLTRQDVAPRSGYDR
jgi:hypothetical protein